MSVTENSPLRTTPDQIHRATTYDMMPECSNINFRLNLFLLYAQMTTGGTYFVLIFLSVIVSQGFTILQV